MITVLHGLSTMHANILTEVRLASEFGFQGVELVESKLLRFLDAGYQPEQLKLVLDGYGIKPACINAIKDVEASAPGEREKLFALSKRIIEAAAAIGCRTIQLVPFCALAGRPYEEARDITAQNIAAIADMGAPYGIRFQLEPIAWSPIHTLEMALDTIRRADRINLGMVIDFWHLWAGGGTKPEDVAKLDRRAIFGVHFCDGVRTAPVNGETEAARRSYLPGDGEIPVQEWVDAVLATGYDGAWSSELLSPYHWEWDIRDIARETLDRMLRYING